LAGWIHNETEHNNVDFVGLLDLHSYSQQILYPYSYTCDDSPPNLENLQEVAAGLSKVMRLSGGRYYQSAPACEGNVGLATNGDRQVFPRFETGGGSFLDWFYHDIRVKYTYQLKLRDRGTYGFLLPKDHIVPTGKEVLDAVIYFGKFLGGQFNVAVGEEKQSNLKQPEQHSQGDELVADAEDVADVEDELDGEDESAMWELRRRRRV
ncbi:hypothetical protein KCU71_g10653, partial [Aureobasidium melanogenum]